jgi:plastocyanin
LFDRAIVKRAGLGAAMAIVAATGLAVPALASNQNVRIIGVGGGFAPDPITVDPGNTVTWTNSDNTAAHDAYCSGPPYCPVAMIINGGRGMASGESESFTFQYSGAYHYICNIHPSMKGTVNVTGNVQPPASSSGGGSGAGSGNGGAGSTTTTQSSPASGSGSTSAAHPGASKPSSVASAAAAGGSNGSATDTGSTGQAVKESLVGINLPRPNVIVRTPKNTGTPQWVLLVAGGALLVCAVLFGLAWFGPPFRRGGKA